MKHINIPRLYKALAKIESFSTPEDCLAKGPLSKLNDAILQGKLLDYIQI